MRRSILLFLILVILGLRLHAAECDPATNVRELHLVSPNAATLASPVRVRFTLQNDTLIADFAVRTSKIFARPHLGPNQYPFQADVVEVFVSGSAGEQALPYFEFELSPYDQTFEVRIDDPKKPFTPGLHLGTKHSVERVVGGWNARLEIPLQKIGWDGRAEHLRANAFAVLGAPPHRTYWSLFGPAQKRPNFHQPQFFREWRGRQFGDTPAAN